ncbi:MAG: type II toxin-antitoxin system RatA family toxin [Pseudomonadota bacterium]
MPTYAEQKFLPYTQAQLFSLVADVDKYPEFLPWCTACRTTRRESETVFFADLVIGYKLIRERIACRVEAVAPDSIHVAYLQGPLKHLSNHWRFIPQDGGCLIDFYVDFELKNAFFQGFMSMFFHEAIQRMVGAFEARAKHLYGMQ